MPGKKCAHQCAHETQSGPPDSNLYGPNGISKNKDIRAIRCGLMERWYVKCPSVVEQEVKISGCVAHLLYIFANIS